MGEAPMFADGRISMYDDRNDGDPEDLRFGSCGETTELTEQYVTTAQYMARDLDDADPRPTRGASSSHTEYV